MQRVHFGGLVALTAGVLSMTALNTQAQHSSGGTPDSVTEATGSGSGGDSGQSSGVGVGEIGESHGGAGTGNQGQRKQPDTPKQAGSQGQQGMKGGGTPMEQDKSDDKLIYDEGKSKGKK